MMSGMTGIRPTTWAMTNVDSNMYLTLLYLLQQRVSLMRST